MFDLKFNMTAKQALFIVLHGSCIPMQKKILLTFSFHVVPCLCLLKTILNESVSYLYPCACSFLNNYVLIFTIFTNIEAIFLVNPQSTKYRVRNSSTEFQHGDCHVMSNTSANVKSYTVKFVGSRARLFI